MPRVQIKPFFKFCKGKVLDRFVDPVRQACNLLILEKNIPSIRPHKASYDVNQSSLSGPVRTYNSQNFSRRKIETYAVKGKNPAKVFCDVTYC